MNWKDRHKREKKAGKGDQLFGSLSPEQSFEKALGLVEQRKFAEAQPLLLPLAAAFPNHAGTLHLLGVIAAESRQDAAAAEWFLKATQAKADFAESWGNLGVVRHRLGQHEDAVQAFTTALALHPAYLQAMSGLGLALKSLGRIEEAARLLEQAVAFKPDFAEGRNNLGMILMAQGRNAEAKVHLEEALKLAPRQAEISNNLGNLAKAEGRLEEAAEFFARAADLKPGFIEARANLGAIRFLQGRNDEAKTVFALAGKAGGGEAMRLRSAMALPAIPASLEEIAAARQELHSVVEQLMASDFTLDDPMRQNGMTPFYLAYHAQNDRLLMEALVRLFLKSCPALGFEALHVRSWKGPAGARPRLGVVSEHRHGHTIGRLFTHLLGALKPNGFEVILFATGKHSDWLQAELAAHADGIHPLPGDLELARQRIAEAKLDLLLYPDIGMTPLTWFLAMARLAPVQAMSWGHPNTSGMPSIDAFLSSGEMETSQAASHYSERLLLVPGPTLRYRRPPPPSSFLNRRELGLPEAGRLYVCPQSPFKLHPAADPALLSVLEQDAGGHLALLSGGDPGLDRRLMARFEQTRPDLLSRLHLVPRLDHAGFLSLLNAADILIDPPHYSGGNTTLEALALGVPVVTWPGEFLRGRFTWGLLNQTGLAEELTASEMSGLGPLAAAIAQDPQRRAKLSEKIRASSAPLFENGEAGRNFAQALKRLIEERQGR
jgi:protein O-GlcNAc transferase